MEEEIDSLIVESDMDDDGEDDFDDDDAFGDPLALDEPLSPPNKKQKLRDVSHLQKKYKGPPSGKRSNQRRGGAKRPLGKMNDPKQDCIYVSDGDIDGDDF